MQSRFSHESFAHQVPQNYFFWFLIDTKCHKVNWEVRKVMLRSHCCLKKPTKKEKKPNKIRPDPWVSTVFDNCLYLQQEKIHTFPSHRHSQIWVSYSSNVLPMYKEGNKLSKYLMEMVAIHSSLHLNAYWIAYWKLMSSLKDRIFLWSQ